MGRLSVLDAFRGLAALSVIIFHYTKLYRDLYGHGFPSLYDFRYGYMGVELFFIISGFVIFLSLNHIKSWKDFVFKRVSRLYPAYWACLAITFLSILTLGLEGKERDWLDFLANITMFQRLLSIPNVDGSYWSLFPELMFYGMMLMLFVTDVKDKIIYVGIPWLLLCFVHLNIMPIKYLSLLLNLEYGVFFYSGILFFLLKENSKEYKLIVVQLLVCFLIAVFGYKFKGQLPQQIIISFIYVVFYLFIQNKLNFLASKPLLFLGSISYPLYLIHQNIGFIIMNRTKAIFDGSILIVLPPIVVSLLLAYLISIFIEKPASQALRDWYSSQSVIDSESKIFSKGTKRIVN
ncbi:acyltransferase family protein [Rufibacter quisquiliarum]|uniref:Peptidoglycan/LPS O-acetylase OafA/YrhL n=1 Tax=Rufibacter quisquiliarum TaxID=1549639 RepID=A0A839GN58_9BACT|nr:acyltransferase [Rufibacter quisquiliarum]MBA9076985.1 peptidoglycan/LPS O-acetylase OafA/YrhL [Rufibacter quisquiliarum]